MLTIPHKIVIAVQEILKKKLGYKQLYSATV